MARPAERRSHRRVLLCCFGVYAILTLTLTAQSIWWDEGISLHLAGMSWRGIVANRAANIHPPLYFFLLKAWTGLVGISPFTGRYLSVLATMLLPAYAYAFVRSRLGDRCGRAVALLVGFAPPFIVYGQETRAYALLPLGLLALWALIWPPPGSRSGSRLEVPSRGLRRGVALGLVQGSLALLHYAGVLAAGVAALAYAYRWLEARRAGRPILARTVLREWLTGAAVTGLLLLPWAVLVLAQGLGGLSQQAGLANALSEPAPAGYVAGLIGVFHTAGLPEALGMPYLARFPLLVCLLVAPAIAIALLRSARRRAVAGMLGLWIIPLAAAVPIWTLSPQSHPRYLYPFVLGGWLLVGTLIGLRAVPKALRLALLGVALTGHLLGLVTYLADPNVARSDVRAAAETIRAIARAGDIALVPDTDWSLAQYDVGAASIQMVPSDVGGPDGETHLGLDAAIGGRIFALDYPRGALDPRGAVRAALTTGAVLTERREFQGVRLEVYNVYRTLALSACQPVVPVCLADADLCLTGLASAPAPVSGGAVPVALCWRKGEDDLARYGVAVRLLGPNGNFITADHDLLLNASQAPTDLWPDQRAASYHLLPLPVGALPFPHSIQISLYDAQSPGASVVLTGPNLSGPAAAVTVGQVTPAISPWRSESLYDLPPLPTEPKLQITSELRLGGAHLDRDVVRPGEAFYTSLQWLLTAEAGDASDIRLGLVCEGSELVTADSVICAMSLPWGRPALETLALPVPPEMPSGVCSVQIRAGDSAYQVGEIEIEGSVHLYEAPSMDYVTEAGVGSVGSLLGFDLEPGPVLAAGAPVTVTLIWRSGDEAPARDLKVFVHLIAEDGSLVAQDDAKPVGWSRPTPSWLPKEVIVDEHALTWRDTSVTGPAHLSVGFYDEVTGDRQVWSTGVDAYDLPAEIQILLP